ncbi:hypothetical protein BgiBS90_028221, partial [Biomphalaria glabrata]
VEPVITRGETVSMSSVLVKVSPNFDETPKDCNDNLANEIKAIKSILLEPEMADKVYNRTTLASAVTQETRNLRSTDLNSKDLSSENLSAEDSQDEHSISLLDLQFNTKDQKIQSETKLVDDTPIHK